MNRLLIFFLILLETGVTAQPVIRRTLGLVADPARYNALPAQAELIKGDELPTSVSLEPYCPSVGQQGPYSTCTAFSTCYNMMTIREAVRRDIKTPANVDELRCSPGYVFEKIKRPDDSECKQGNLLENVLVALNKYGVPLLKDLAYPSCGQVTAALDAKARLHRIPDKIICPTQEKYSPQQRIALTKAALSSGMPVVFGMHALPSFQAGAGNVWTPAPNEQPQSGDGHALCLVGYDDNRYGGAFRLINSWGPEWGEGGFYWVRYTDYLRYNMGSFAVFPDAAAPTKAIQMKAQVDFQLRDGKPMPVNLTTVQRGMAVGDDPTTTGTQRLVVYRMTQPYTSGTAFKCKVSNDQPAYVYAINIDGRSLNPLFPYAPDVSPALLAKSTLLLPSARKSIVLDATPGQEQVLLLFSKTPLDLTTITQALGTATGSFSDRVMAVLGSDLIPSSAIRYASDRVGFQVAGDATGSIVPLLIELDHQ